VGASSPRSARRRDLLVLDEPTSGLDPIVRREFIEAVDPARTSKGFQETARFWCPPTSSLEFEGLIDESRSSITAAPLLDTRRATRPASAIRKIARAFAQPPPEIDLQAALRGPPRRA